MLKSRTASPTSFMTPACDPPVMIQAPAGTEQRLERLMLCPQRPQSVSLGFRAFPNPSSGAFLHGPQGTTLGSRIRSQGSAVMVRLQRQAPSHLLSFQPHDFCIRGFPAALLPWKGWKVPDGKGIHWEIQDLGSDPLRLMKAKNPGLPVPEELLLSLGYWSKGECQQHQHVPDLRSEVGCSKFASERRHLMDSIGPAPALLRGRSSNTALSSPISGASWAF